MEGDGYVRTSKQLQNKYGDLKARWIEREELKDKSGFGVDPVTSRVTAPAGAWDAIKEVSYHFHLSFLPSYL